MIMNKNVKQGVLSLLGGVGLIVLIAGIFLDSVQFTYALFLAISIWVLTGVVSTFFGVNRRGEFTNTNWKNGLVSLISSIGVIILLSGVFLQVSFSYAIVGALVFWVLAGATSSFLGVKHKHRRKYNQYSSIGSQYATPGPVYENTDQYDSYNQNNRPPQKINKFYGELAKHSCPKCGASMHLSDTFCSNCGSSIEPSF